jgi:hypothetical protein
MVDGSVSSQDFVQALKQGRWHLVTATSTPDHRAQAPFELRPGETLAALSQVARQLAHGRVIQLPVQVL